MRNDGRTREADEGLIIECAELVAGDHDDPFVASRLAHVGRGVANGDHFDAWSAEHRERQSLPRSPYRGGVDLMAPPDVDDEVQWRKEPGPTWLLA